jgi:hypothetical protein
MITRMDSQNKGIDFEALRRVRVSNQRIPKLDHRPKRKGRRGLKATMWAKIERNY